MMAKVNTKVVTVFELDVPTTLWLKDLVKQPIYEDESEKERTFRQAIYSAIISVDTHPLQVAAVDLDDIPF